MLTRLTFTALVAAAAILTIDSRLALALQCGHPAPTLLAPADGESDVPVNAKLWFGYYWPERGVTVQLRGPEGPIAVDQRTVMVHSWAAQVVVPRQELRPSTQYEIEMTCANGDCPGIRRFTTGVGRAVMVPLPVLLKQTPHAAPFGKHVIRSVQFEFGPGALVVVADIVGRKPVRPDAPESFFEGPWGPAQIIIGVGPCPHPTLTPPPGDSHLVRFGQVDIAGNFSGWTTPVPFTLPDAPGCSVAAAPAGGWTLPAVALAVLVVRRRRSSATRLRTDPPSR